MQTKIIISIQTVAGTHQELSLPLGNEPEKTAQTHWQFSAESLSTGNLIELLLNLESLGFDTDA